MWREPVLVGPRSEQPLNGAGPASGPGRPAYCPRMHEPQDEGTLELHLLLRFSAATCDSCGAEVAFSESCACGAWQGKPDPLVDERRARLGIVAEAMATLAETADIRVVTLHEPEPPLDTLSAATDLLSPWITDFFRLLNGSIETGAPYVDQLRAHVEHLARLRAVLAAAHPPRPWIALWRPILQTVDKVGGVAGSFVEAALAPTREAAVRGERLGQAALDEAAASIAVVSVRIGIWRQERTVRVPDSVVHAAARAYEMIGATDLLDLDARAERVYARITGRPATTRGIGVAVAVETAHITDAFDEDRFWADARAAFDILARDPDTLRSLLADAAWADALVAARRDLYDGLVETEVLLRGLREGEERMEVDAVLQLGARIAESVARRFLGLLLAVTHPQRAAGLLHRKAAVVLRQAEQAGLAHLMYGFDQAIRNAATHRDYRLNEGGVSFTPGTGEYEFLTYLELVDRVLGALESATLLCVALDCATADAGIPLADALPDMALCDRVALMLGVAGIVDASVDAHHDVLRVLGRARTGILVKPMVLVAFLIPVLPAEVDVLHLTIERGDGSTITASGPLAPFRRETDGSPGREAVTVETLAKWKVDDRAVASRAYVRRWAAISSARALDEPSAAGFEHVDTLIVLARRVGDQELQSALVAHLEVMRARETGRIVPRKVRRRQLRLVSWLQSPATELNDGDPAPSSPLPPGAAPA
jgi:hypothetical protein